MGREFAIFSAIIFFLGLALNTHAWGEDRSLPAKRITDLSDDDRRILDNGEIRGGRRAAGTILAIAPGLGIGHAVHGRYWHRGWIFTLGELGGAALVSSSLQGCESATDGCLAALLGFSTIVGFKVWEFVDSIVGTSHDNRQYQKLKLQSQSSAESGITIMPIALVKRDDDGRRATNHIGIGMNWSFH